LIEAIEEYLQIHNNDPKPFVWTASVQSILDKVNRCKAILETCTRTKKRNVQLTRFVHSLHCYSERNAYLTAR
jgi:hypothetical protein